MIGVLGILLSLALLMYLAYRGINVLVLAPLLSLLAVVAGGDTGSATGGLSLALGMLGKTYAEAGAAAGINPELLHRVATICIRWPRLAPPQRRGDYDPRHLPVTHRESSIDIFMVTVIGPLAALTVVLILGSTWGSF